MNTPFSPKEKFDVLAVQPVFLKLMMICSKRNDSSSYYIFSILRLWQKFYDMGDQKMADLCLKTAKEMLQAASRKNDTRC